MSPCNSSFSIATNCFLQRRSCLRGSFHRQQRSGWADPGITGAVMAEGYEETLALALRLHPSTTQVYVVAKWPELRFDSLQADLRAFESRARIHYLTEEPLADVLKAVRAAPRDSLVLFIRYADDSSGQRRQTTWLRAWSWKRRRFRFMVWRSRI